ncbi:peptide chain release factor aRF-1 [Halorussus marinus]|uniref:peptide chain release factor aRF-1 n=1 Tax=Halorussus marinus TaxID=2505976 RepID=UPI00106ED1C1|nr:peptide chain release factor aRF-1 [Halorussus marinus]
MNVESHELRERIERVRAASANGDDLVTLAVPPDESLGAALERIEEDRAQAEYIDADESDKAVRRALERVRRVVQGYDGTPESGLVVYAGVVDGEVVDYVFDDLPTPVPEYQYVRDNEFDPGPLDAVAESSGTYGLLVVERGGAALGLTAGDSVTVVETIDSDVMGKTKAGGQSADRFERDRERQKEEFFETVADEARRAFLGEHAAESASAETTVEGLVLGGTTVTAEDFREGDHLDHRLREALVDTFSVEYASEQGLRELAEKATDRIEDEERRETDAALDRFFEALHDGDDGDVVYGREDVETALEYDAVETLLVSGAQSIADVRELQERATEAGGDCLVVPEDFERGVQFRDGFGGAGALLRFPID